MQLPITLLNGGQKVVELPDDHDDPKADSLIEIAAQEICLELARRKPTEEDKNAKGGKHKKESDLAKWIRPVCYRFIIHCEKQGLLENLYSRIKSYGRYTDKEELFSRALLAIFAEDRANFTETDRRRYNRQLWYAYRHYVPWEFLNGFITTVQDFDKKKSLATIENGFAEWIIMNRTNDHDTTGIRESYPKYIEQEVRKNKIGMAKFFKHAQSGYTSEQ